MSCPRIAYWKSTVPDPANRTIRPYDSVLLIERGATVLSQSGQDAPSVIRMNRIQERLRIVIEAGAGASPHSFICRADVQRLAAGRVGRPHDLFNCFCDLAKAVFALLERLLGPFTVADILNDGNEIGRSAGGIAHERHRKIDPHPDVVAAMPARLHGERRIFADEQLVELTLRHGEIIWMDKVLTSAPQHGLRGISQCFAQPRIDAEELFVQTQLSDADSGMLEECSPTLLTFPHVVFGEASLGNVFAHDEQENLPPMVHDCLRPFLHPQCGSVLPDLLDFPLEHLQGAGGTDRQLFQDGRMLFGFEDAEDRLANQVLGSVAELRRTELVDGDDRAI